MAVSAKWYGLGVKTQFGATAADRSDWVADTIKAALASSAYTPNQDTHDYFNDITNELANGSGYTSGGVALANKSLTYDTATNETRLDADDVSWTSFTTADVRYVIIYKDTGTASTSKLFGYVDLGSAQAITAGTLALTWDSTGVLKITAS